MAMTVAVRAPEDLTVTERDRVAELYSAADHTVR